MFKKNKKQSGFTLIELLVIISIIGLLASIVLTSLSSARAKGRDAKRIQDLKQMDTAIQLYIDKYGHAPYLGANNCTATNPIGYNPCASVSVAQKDNWAILESELSEYLSKLPTDPCGETCNVDRRWAAYIYKSPSSISQWCNGSCGLSESEMETAYSIFAGVMESSSSNYNTVYQNTPTFGFKNHSLLNSF